MSNTFVGGEGFAVDASLIQADAEHRSIPGAEWNKDIDPAQALARSKSTGTLTSGLSGTTLHAKFVSPSIHLHCPPASATCCRSNRTIHPIFFQDLGSGIHVSPRFRTAIAAKAHCELRLAPDTAYGSAANLDWLVYQQGIAPHVPVIDSWQRDDGAFNREDFTLTRSVMFTSARRG